jgi:hypothetical protein
MTGIGGNQDEQARAGGLGGYPRVRNRFHGTIVYALLFFLVAVPRRLKGFYGQDSCRWRYRAEMRSDRPMITGSGELGAQNNASC